jgi:predicted RNA-binding Zn ribbon-like protein
MKNSPMSKSKKRFTFVGNRLCIDFVNTRYSAEDAAGVLHSWHDLVDFLEAAGASNRSETRRLRDISVKNPEQCGKTFAHGIALRESIRMILSAIEGRHRLKTEWIEVINTVLRANDGYEQLSPRSGDWRLIFIPRRLGPMQALMPIAQSAADLITEGKAAPVRKCANPDCILYFFDVSRSRRRRWCSMAVCGNRMKVAAYARRRKP